jgi:hypothetical protein
MTLHDYKLSPGARFSALSLLLFIFLSAVSLSASAPDAREGAKAAQSLSLEVPVSYRSSGGDDEERSAAKLRKRPDNQGWSTLVANVYSFDLQIFPLFAFSARGPPQLR